jgi:hypothetical protein
LDKIPGFLKKPTLLQHSGNIRRIFGASCNCRIDTRKSRPLANSQQTAVRRQESQRECKDRKVFIDNMLQKGPHAPYTATHRRPWSNLMRRRFAAVGRNRALCRAGSAAEIGVSAVFLPVERIVHDAHAAGQQAAGQNTLLTRRGFIGIITPSVFAG